MMCCARPVLNAEMESVFLPVSPVIHIRLVMDVIPAHAQNREIHKRHHVRKRYVVRSAAKTLIVKMTTIVILPEIAAVYSGAQVPADLESLNAPSPAESPPVAAMAL